MPPTPFLIGVDLGTTNSAVAAVDTRRRDPRVEVFRIPQLTAPGVVEPRPVLPSFLYFPEPDEIAGGRHRAALGSQSQRHRRRAGARSRGARRLRGRWRPRNRGSPIPGSIGTRPSCRGAAAARPRASRRSMRRRGI